MSKSSPDTASRILLTDASTQIRAKTRGAVADSTQGITYDPVARPGASNLLNILAARTDRNVAEVAAAKEYENKGRGQLKSEVADAVEEMLKGPRAGFDSIRHEKVLLEERCLAGDGTLRGYRRRGRRWVGLS